MTPRFESQSSPYDKRLSPNDIADILKEFEGLTHSGEYFNWHDKNNNKHYVHAWDKIPQREGEGGEVTLKPIREYLQDKFNNRQAEE